MMDHWDDWQPPPMGSPRGLGWLALVFLLAGLIALSFVGCTPRMHVETPRVHQVCEGVDLETYQPFGCVWVPMPRCRVQAVDYTDYDEAGAVVGHRTGTYQVCVTR